MGYVQVNGNTYWQQPNGDLVPCANVGTHQAAREAQSHQEFFKAKDDAHRLRRQSAVEELVKQLTNNPLPSGVVIKTISDESMTELMLHPEEHAKLYFTPFAAYAHKALKYRKMIPGEVGIVEKPGEAPFYYVLEEGYGKAVQGADLFAVEMIFSGKNPSPPDPDDKEALCSGGCKEEK